MRPGPEHRGVRTAVVVLLAGLYFLLAMGVTLLGSAVYRSAAADAEERFVQRTALSYVVNQVRRGDAEGVFVGTFGGGDALCLTETLPDGSAYVTYIYCCGGSLRELYMEKGTGLPPEDGIPVLALDSLTLDVEGGLLSVTAGLDGRSWSVSIAPRTGLREVGAL